MADVKSDLISLSNHVYERTQARLHGLTDDEYFWEPAPACWSLHPGADGELRADVVEVDDHLDGAPFTTIAWRLWHLVGCYGSARSARWLGLGQPAGGFEQEDPAPATARLALDALERADGVWREVLDALPAASWLEPLGAVAGPYGESSRASFVLHQLDEQIHHGAELGVLRDLHCETFRT